MRRRFLNKKSKSISIDYESQYFTIEALEDGLTAKLSTNSCEYTLDGMTWITLAANTNTQSINTGQKIQFRINVPTISSSYGIGTFTISKKCNVSGNIMSLLFGNDFSDKIDLTGKNYVFYALFRNCNSIISSRNLILPATILSNSCYFVMFSGCKSLEDVPVLPAKELSPSCYSAMFQNCASLKEAPQLLSTKLAENCYYYMFRGCTSLIEAPELPATTLAGYCYKWMFYNCKALITAPDLPATILNLGCYDSMFFNCTSLSYIKMLAIDISASSCLSNWVSGVSSTGTFVKHPDMTSLSTGSSGIPDGWTVVNYNGSAHSGGADN